MARGIEERHGRGCRTRRGGRCDCEPTYRAKVWDGTRKRRYSRAFPSRADAEEWQREAASAVRYGAVPRLAPTDTLEAIAKRWLDDARAGVVRNRSGDPFKPSAIRAYEAALRLRVLPAFGERRLPDIRRSDLQRFVNRLLGEGVHPSTIMVTLLPLRAIYRQAIADDAVKDNPTRELTLPAVRGRRDRFASLAEAAALLAALEPPDRALWATAMYAGLRRGELQALRWEDVDLARGVLRVRHGWDDKEGMIFTKSRESRTVPIASVLRDHLLDQRVAAGDRATGYVFGATQTRPFAPTAVTSRARAAWDPAGLPRITLHECRHSYASLMIAAGVNAKALSTYMGHANISITMDRYGHMMPGNEDEAAALFDAYVERESAKARHADGSLSRTPCPAPSETVL